MAETLLSPGVLARENDQSFISAQPVQAGAALVGPTVTGPVEIPTLVTSYSQYKNIFGATFESGSQTYSYLTSLSAFNYFQNGGDSLLVTRVTSGSFTAAESTRINTNLTDGLLLTTKDALLGSINSGFNISSSAGNGPTGSITGIAMTGSISGSGAVASFNFATSESVSSITVTTA